jgi:hypothetical protein
MVCSDAMPPLSDMLLAIDEIFAIGESFGT